MVISLQRVLAPGALLLLATAASACPLCDTETGRQVRADLLAADFAVTLLSVIAPFPVLLLLVAALHHGMRRFDKLSSSGTPPAPSSSRR